MLVVVAMVGLGLFSRDSYLATKISRISISTESNSASSSGHRLTFWMTSLDMFKEEPLLGCGVGDWPSTFDRVFAEAEGYGGRVMPDTVEHVHAHNYPIHLLSTQGILGVAAHLWWWFVLIGALWNLRKKAHPWSLAAFASMAALLGMGMANPTFITYYLLAASAPIGVALARGAPEK